MNRPKFFIYAMQVSKNGVNLPVDIRLPDDMETITGILFTVPPDATNNKPAPVIGEISISLDGGITNMIHSYQVKVTGTMKDLIRVNEKPKKNAFAKVIYKDYGVQVVNPDYRVKIYFLYTKKQKQCTATS